MDRDPATEIRLQRSGYSLDRLVWTTDIYRMVDVVAVPWSSIQSMQFGTLYHDAWPHTQQARLLLQWPTPTNTWWAYQCLEVRFHTPLSPPPSSATRSSAYLRYTVFKEAPLPLGSGLPPLRYQKGGNVSDFQPAPSSASR